VRCRACRYALCEVRCVTDDPSDSGGLRSLLWALFPQSLRATLMSEGPNRRRVAKIGYALLESAQRIALRHYEPTHQYSNESVVERRLRHPTHRGGVRRRGTPQRPPAHHASTRLKILAEIVD
jgi:hypothetical protein